MGSKCDPLPWSRGVARVFGARGADFRLAPPPGAPPPPPPPQKKFVIHQNLRNRLNYSKNLAIKKQIKFLVGRFLVVRTQHFHIFGRSYLFFVNAGAPKRQLTVIFFRNRLKLFYKTVTLYYLLASLAPLQLGARGGSPPPPPAPP